MAETEKTRSGSDQIDNLRKLVERLSDYTTAMRLLPMFLMANILLMWKDGKNITALDSTTGLTGTIGQYVCLLIGGILALTFVTRVAKIPASALLHKVKTLFFAPDKEKYRGPREPRVEGTKVWLTVAYEWALREKDSFTMARVNAREAEVLRARGLERDLAYWSFATLFFAAIDYFCFPSTSILQALSVQLQQAGGTYFQLAVFASIAFPVALPWLMETPEADYERIWIEHPALADELQAAFRKHQTEVAEQSMRLVHRSH